MFGLPHKKLRETEARVLSAADSRHHPPEMPAEGGSHHSDSATTGCMFGLPHEKLRETEARVQSLQGWVTVFGAPSEALSLPACSFVRFNDKLTEIPIG